MNQPLQSVLRAVTALAMGHGSSPVRLIEAKRWGDHRGWFAESYNRDTFAALGIAATFVQDNHSLSIAPYTLRGLHFQLPPHAQDKLVRCVRGRIYDVSVDIRRGSPTYGTWVGAELSAETGSQLFIPAGFAHGFLTLEPNTEVIYKCSDTYDPELERGFRWNDPALAIEWPLPAHAAPQLSPKDAIAPPFPEFVSPFAFDGRILEPVA